MTRDEQKELLTAFCDRMRDSMLEGASNWPAEWDGHELRELAASRFEFERTNVMRTDRRRRKAFLNTLRTTPI